MALNRSELISGLSYGHKAVGVNTRNYHRYLTKFTEVTRVNDTYFSLENAMKRFFFVTGRTSDEFYSDGLLKLNIEQLLHMELKQSGYKRVAFYDKKNKLYTYDDESFDLMNKERNQDASEWQKGDKSGITVRNIVNSVLHMGRRDDILVEKAIDAYMDDKAVKTAIVINDPTAFFEDLKISSMHSFTSKYERMLGTDNENIIIFIYTNEQAESIFGAGQFKVEESSKANVINIGAPSSNEIKNMLMYMRIRHGLPLRMSDLNTVAVALHQAMSLGGIGIKETYIRLLDFIKKKEYLTEEACYAMAKTKKPVPAKEQLKSLIGMQSVKKQLLKYEIKDNNNRTAGGGSRVKPELLETAAKDQMIHFILTGNPGTGKTTVAKLIGQLFYEMGYLSTGHVIETDRSGLVAGYIGQTALKTRKKVMDAMGGVLFIDEAYSLAKSLDGENEEDSGQEAIDTLVKLMDEFRGKFTVVAAGCRDKMDAFESANPGFARRFGENHIHIEDYTAEEILRILVFQAKRNGYIFSDELMKELPNFCENWVNQADENWGNAKETENLIDLMNINWKKDPSGLKGEEGKILEKKHIPDSRMIYFRPLADIRSEMINSFNNMVGLEGVKNQIETLRRRMRFGDMKVPGHYLFEGNPGTGKTTVARYMGQIMKNFGLLKRGHIKEYSAEELKTEYISKSVNGDFGKIADKAVNGVLFIDEAYQLQNDAIGKHIMDNLLTYSLNHKMDMCIVLAGYEDEMESLLEYNPGLKDRFPNKIIFDNYSGAELYEILINTLRQKNIAFDEEFEENSKRILFKYIPVISKDKSFSNVRYLNDIFIPTCLDERNKRLTEEFGDRDIPDYAMRLSGSDLPQELIHYTSSEVKTIKSETAIDKINKLVGFHNVKSVLSDLIEQGETARRENMPDLLENLSFHWVLKGNPGTGKTAIAKLVGQVYKEMGVLPKGHTVKVTRQNLVGEHIGETSIKTQRKIDEAMGGILFIDEAYTLKPSEGHSLDFGQEAIDTILEQMSSLDGEFGVIVAGYPEAMDRFINSNDGLKSRFEQEFVLKDYTAGELTEIFISMCNEKGYYVSGELEEILPQLFEAMSEAKIKGWANAREAEKLLRKMITQWTKNIIVRMNENGEKERVFVSSHLPKEYADYLENKETANKEKQDKEQRFLEINNFFIEEKQLKSRYNDFDYAREMDSDFKTQKEGTVYIRATRTKDIIEGSGVLITDTGYILTCAHVIRGCDNILVMLTQYAINGTSRSWEQAELIWYDEEIDAAIIKISEKKGLSLPIAAPDVEFKTGEEIYMLGFPFGETLSDDLNGLCSSMFKGYISSIQKKRGLDKINVNMEAKQGCSGGPVFSKEEGYIIGIFSGSHIERSDRDGDGDRDRYIEEINYVLPIKYIWERAIGEDKFRKECETI